MRPRRPGIGYVWLSVSIHAPVKDATDFYFPEFAHLSVSIHAPVKDATLDIDLLWHIEQFQSTHP